MINEFIVGSWLTITIVIISYLVLLGRKMHRLDIGLEREKTRSLEVDKHHDEALNKIEQKIHQINTKMDTVLRAYQDTKEILLSRINTNSNPPNTK